MAQKNAASYPVHGTSALKPISQNEACSQVITPAPILDFSEYTHVKQPCPVATLERKKVQNYVEGRSAKRPSVNARKTSSLIFEDKRQQDRFAFGLCFSATFISMVSLIVLGV